MSELERRFLECIHFEDFRCSNVDANAMTNARAVHLYELTDRPLFTRLMSSEQNHIDEEANTLCLQCDKFEAKETPK